MGSNMCRLHTQAGLLDFQGSSEEHEILAPCRNTKQTKTSESEYEWGPWSKAVHSGILPLTCDDVHSMGAQLSPGITH